MKNFNLLFKTVLVLGLAFGLTACGGKSDSRRANINSNRVAANINGIPGTQNANVFSSPYGKVFNNSNDMSESVRAFLGLAPGDSQVGSVSGNPNSTSTGIVLDAMVNTQSGTGSLKLYIWDDIALQNNQVIAVQLQLDGSRSSNNQLVFNDTYGDVILNIQSTQNGVASGVVSYSGGTLGTGQLGQFQINQNALFR